MHQSHGMGYEEYARSLKKVMQVERTREKEYYESKHLIADIQLMHS